MAPALHGIISVTEIKIGAASYRLFALHADGQWIARAFRADTGDRFGLDARASTEAAAVQQLQDWLQWHHEHLSALEALREAERAYHRAVTGSAFSGREGDGQDAERGSLERLDRARSALDAVRRRQPV